MECIVKLMSNHHEHCDLFFAQAEQAVLNQDWTRADSDFKQFKDGMAQHFKREEDVLFPEFLSSGGPVGPVNIMRMEHQQINGLLDQMAVALSSRDSVSYSGIAETLLIVMQQHNMKEEQILYPMADQVLAAKQGQVLEQLAAI